MTAIELLKQGIENQDWNDIQQVYSMFTGMPVDKKTTKKKTKTANSKAVEAIVTKPIDDYDINNYIVTGIKNPDNTDADGRRKARTEPINISKIKGVGNMFADELEIATADIEIDRKIKHTKIQKRKPAQQRIYDCSGTCGRKFKLFPSQALPDGTYKCSQCIQQQRN